MTILFAFVGGFLVGAILVWVFDPYRKAASKKRGKNGE